MNKSEIARQMWKDGSAIDAICAETGLTPQKAKAAISRERNPSVIDKVAKMMDLGWSTQKMAETLELSVSVTKRLIREYRESLGGQEPALDAYWWKKLPREQVVSRLMEKAHRDCHLTRITTESAQATVNYNDPHPEYFNFLEKCRNWWADESNEWSTFPSRRQHGGGLCDSYLTGER